MSKHRVVKARFYRRGVQVREFTGTFLVSATDDTVKRAMIDTYRTLQREREEAGLPDDGGADECDSELEVKLEEIFDPPGQDLNLTAEGREEHGNDG
jgi:hypothetical protein